MKHRVIAIAAFLITACDSDPASPPLPPRDQCVIAVVASDYSSTAISLLTSDGALCAPDIITSGSRPPGLLTALSGDVVLPSEPDPRGLLHVLDRYPNGVMTTVDPTTSEVVAQLAIGTLSDPHDIAFVDGPPSILLTRMEYTDPESTADGSDLLRVPLDGSPNTRFDLTTYADRPRLPGKPDYDPMPDRFARASGRLWVGLTHLTTDFLRAAPGRALALDPGSLAVTHTLDLSPLQNCGTVASPGPDAGLWVVCSGLFRVSPNGPQLAFSGLAWLAPDLPAATTPPSALTPTWLRHAADLHPADVAARPLGFTLAALDDEHALVVALGDLATDLPDRLLLVTRTTNTVTTVAESRAAFEFGAVLPRPLDRIILVADGNPYDPRVRRFTWPTDAEPATELAPIDISPSGLPPRHLAVFR